MNVSRKSEPRKERFKTPAAVFILFIKDNKILLHRRHNTGWMDGKYDALSGHVEEGETIKETSSREILEETGLVVPISDLDVVHLMHCGFDDSPYFQIYLRANKFSGTPTIMESEKCDDMDWFDLDKLPDNLVPYVRQAIEEVNNGEFYSEYGWDKNI